MDGPGADPIFGWILRRENRIISGYSGADYVKLVNLM